MKSRFVLSLSVAGFLAACSSSPLPTELPAATSLDGFGANPNPLPANVATQFSWSVAGQDLLCQLDVDSDGVIDYTVDNCGSHSRVNHTYGTPGTYEAKLTVTGQDRQVIQKSTRVTVTGPNTPPAIPVLTASTPPGAAQPLAVRFDWTVSDPDSDTTHCRFDAESDGVWEFDDLCSGLPASSSVGKASSTVFSYTHLYQKPGNYRATLEAADPYLATRSELAVRAPWNRAPVIENLKTTTTDSLTGRVAFEVSDPDGDPFSCILQVETIGKFAYPNCATLTRSFRFAAPGSYRVSLEVTDRYQGRTSRTASIVLSLVSEGWTAVDGGKEFTCGLRVGGSAWCWGSNASGQLGNDDTVGQFTPVAVAGTPSGTAFTSIRAARNGAHACGLRNDGSIWCWGLNQKGQLGNDSTTDSQIPVQVVGGGIYTAVETGSYHTCGLRDDGSVWCWGENMQGRLGNNSTSDSDQPVQVAGGGSYLRISAGWKHTCGLRTDYSLWCWGDNGKGQLGNDTVNGSLVPVQVYQGTNFRTVVASWEFTCGLRSNGTAWCWGSNDSGQLGINSTSDSLRPVAVQGGHTFTQVALGQDNSCGLRPDGTAWCWGENSDTQLGDGSLAPKQLLPVPVVTQGVSGTRFKAIAAGAWHTCGLRDDDSLWCWGYNYDGQLGNGDLSGTNSGLPAHVVVP